MTTRLLVGDVFARMAELDDHSFDLIVTSPPFLALRSYLPDDHPDKALEIGSEATPADYLDTLLALTAEWRRLLAPHGSIAIELGDTYAGSGGGGGDYDAEGLRAGQPRFNGSGRRIRETRREGYIANDIQPPPRRDITNGWPLDKSLTGIPTLYTWSLAYGRNLLTGQESPAGRWRIRNLKPWIRSNPPVGALGDKERPATSYITVACTSSSRWFDLDAVRTTPSRSREGTTRHKVRDDVTPGTRRGSDLGEFELNNPGGAPPLDWWHPVDAVIDAVIDQRAGMGANRRTAKGVDSQPRSGKSADRDGNWHDLPELGETNGSVGARGVHIRRALTEAGHLTNSDFYDVSPRGYAGAHYAVWPPELVRLLVDEMCPRRVCVECGVPSRRIVESKLVGQYAENPGWRDQPKMAFGPGGDTRAERTTLGWSDCGCTGDHWRPGRVLDPFSGSGTTLAVASGMGRDSVGIDLDPRNADLTLERVGMFLEVDYGTREATA